MKVALVATQPLVRRGLGLLIRSLVPGARVTELPSWGAVDPKAGGRGGYDLVLALDEERWDRPGALPGGGDGAPPPTIVISLQPGPAPLGRRRPTARIRRLSGEASPEELRQAIQDTVAPGAASDRDPPGRDPTGDGERREWSGPVIGPEELTPRELQIVRLVADGRTNREIAGEVFLSEATVKAHLKHIFAKLGVRNRTQAALRVRGAGERGVQG